MPIISTSNINVGSAYKEITILRPHISIVDWNVYLFKFLCFCVSF